MATHPGVHGQHEWNLTGLGWSGRVLGKWGTDLGGTWRGDEYDQITLYKILKELVNNFEEKRHNCNECQVQTPKLFQLFDSF